MANRDQVISVSITNKIGEIEDTLFNSLEKRILMATIELHGKVVEKLSGQRTGEQYPVPGTGQVVNKEKKLPNGRMFYYRKLEGATYYTASADFEPPAVRLGDLRTSIDWKVRGQGPNAEGFVGSPLPYARRLEYGFIGLDEMGRHYQMAPRPYIKPTFDENVERISRFFKGLL